MAHQTFKVCILIDDNVENFYIKHYIDQINPVFNRFKNQVFTRNPLVNAPNLKIYWIDAENDQILVACEEDFRLFLEEGKGRKIFFSVNNTHQNEENEATPMEAENIEPERRSRKSHKEHEKGCKRYEKLTKKLRHYEESCKNEEERSRCRHAEKRNERLEKAKRRVEQIRSIIGSIDPANLGSANNSEPTPSTSTSHSTNESVPQIQSPISPETIQLLSNAIAGCLQPCNVINKVLNEVFAIIPQVVEQTTAYSTDQQQQTAEVPKQNTATNTSDASTPVTRQASHEIEALFKEAAKELEKMNEIVNNSNTMEGSSSSLTTEGTQGTQVTQIERVFPNISDSAISDITVVESFDHSKGSVDNLDATFTTVAEEPPKSSRSRESSIEIHDVNSMMSDDSRDWTILSQDDISIEPVAASQRSVDPKTGAVPKGTVPSDTSSQCDAEIQTADPIKSISIETQTPTTLLFNNNEQLQASVQKSMDIVQKSIETIQKSMEGASSQKLIESEKQPEQGASAPSIDIYPNLPTAPVLPEQSKANIIASGINLAPEKPKQKFLPGLIVYDPNPKINAAVHTMMNMGFSNEDNWLTQLLINVDGDIPKALNFLTPQPKNKKA